ncbi:hypothetical protein [Massilimicrobiota timonensis]|uniref:hypothetical protein n=1 Tax=Massilimicrobiota timonensis TaxID=1776392 RepID=UPI00195FA1FD|nr:hypothetical protein [Massilimicrobiota timonensis]MBM6966104.1 hypothetical protein [Massilimicrobiota timonensis]
MENKKSFAEKYPKINFLLGLALLIGIVIFVIWLIKILYNSIVNGLIKLTAIASKLDAVIIVALITGLVSIVGVIISSIFAKIVDYRKSRQEYLTQKREKPYGEFVEMIYKVQRNTKIPGTYSDEEMLKDLSKFSRQITLWGSPRVINKWIQFRENGSNPEKAKDNLFLMEEIMNDMRKDLGLRKVKKGNLLGFFVNDIKSVIKK